MSASDKKNDVIRHFTDVSVLFRILKNGLKFSSGNQWPDEDDKYDIERYRQIVNNDIGVLCFCDGLGSIYHWTNLGSNRTNRKKIKCYIALYKEDFLKYVNSIGRFEQPRNVIYCHDAEILSQDIVDIPYLKEREYKIENELRILYIGEDVEKGIFIPEIIHYIKCISISNKDCSRAEFAKIKNEIESLYPVLRGKIIQKSTDWKNKIELLINHKSTKI